MIGRDDYSALRSLRRFVGNVLPAPWDVQFSRREPQVRPLAIVRFVGPVTSSGSAYVREYERAVEIFLYPEPVEGDAPGSEMKARKETWTLARALDSGHAGAGGKAFRVPFYDYTEVQPGGVLPADAVPFDYLVLRNLTFDVRNDPDSDELFTGIIDFRVNWRDDGDTGRFSGLPLQYITIDAPTTSTVGKDLTMPWTVRQTSGKSLTLPWTVA